MAPGWAFFNPLLGGMVALDVGEGRTWRFSARAP
jgi:hypothetical protein